MALENDELEAKPVTKLCEAEMAAMRTISLSELTTSIAITVMICSLMMMALG